MSARTAYTVRARRDGSWWLLEVDGVDSAVTQARRLDQVEATARDLIATLLEVPEDSFDIEITPSVPDDMGDEVGAALAARGLAIAAQEAARAATGRAARHLRDEGLPVRDIGRLLGVSYQRAAKILTPGEAAAIRREVDLAEAVEAARRHGLLVDAASDSVPGS